MADLVTDPVARSPGLELVDLTHHIPSVMGGEQGLTIVFDEVVIFLGTSVAGELDI